MPYELKYTIDANCDKCKNAVGEEVYDVAIQPYVPLSGRVSAHGGSSIFKLCSQCQLKLLKYITGAR